MVNKEQAALVRRIFGSFLQGLTPYSIADRLTADGIRSPGGKEKWSARAVSSILINEKYKGDALLQKSYTVDFLTKKKKANTGEIPQYYVKNNHEAIIDPEVFDMVQREIQQRKPGRNRYSGVRVFSGKIHCGECGGLYGSKIWHSNDPYRRVIWQCNHKFDKDRRCTTPHFDEETLKQMFLAAFNQLISERDEIQANFEIIKETLYGAAELEREQIDLQSELEVAAGIVERCIRENASTVLDQEEYQKRYDAMCAMLDSVKERLEVVTAQITEKVTRRETIEQFLASLIKQPALVIEFDPMTWHTMVEGVTVCSLKEVRFAFRGGAEITISS